MPSVIASHWRVEQENLALMLDYDGTLTPIVKNPDHAFISTDRVEILRLLARHPKIHLAIVSGRSVSKLLEFMRPLQDEKILFCGLHGGEIYDPKLKDFLLSPEKTIGLNFLTRFKEDLLLALKNFNWIQQSLLIEDKNYSLALHYRNAEPLTKHAAISLFEKKFHSSAELVESFKLQPGKEVLEVLPKSFDKGQCVNFLYHLWRKTNSVYPVYVGDDLTDEFAFQAVNRLKGLSVCIGKPLDQTEAKNTLTAIDELYKTLEGIF